MRSFTPTDLEQLTLELINRARTDPQGEVDAVLADIPPFEARGIQDAIDFFNVDMGVFRQQLTGVPTVAPLGWNHALANAAAIHNQAMIDADKQSHLLPGERGLFDRIEDAGYENGLNVAENIYAYVDGPYFGHAGFFIDWGYGPNGIQDPAGHRDQILSDTYTEIGISYVAENNPATSVGPYVITHEFGLRSDYNAQLVGVVHHDSDNDDAYDAGEGLGGITVQVTGNGTDISTETWASGGYQLALDPGTYTVTYSGAGLISPQTRTITMGPQNTKLDLAVDAVNSAKQGTRGADTIIGSNSADLISGLDSADRLEGRGGNDTLRAGTGNDTLLGGAGDDTYSVNGRTTDRVEITDPLGTNTLEIWDYPESDALDFVNTQDAIIRTTTFGNTTTINKTNGIPDVTFVRWTAVDETGAQTPEPAMRLVTDITQITSLDILYAGTDADETITLPALDASTLTLKQGNVFGNGGDDNITLPSTFPFFAFAGTGNDTVTGTDLDELLKGQSGDDLLLGGGGYDVLYGNEGSDTLRGGNGTDWADLGDGDDLYTDTAQGGVDGQDTAIGRIGDDTILTGNGDDLLYGSEGQDSLNGQNGSDLLSGGAGFDTLIGEAGNDTVFGGNGRDRGELGAGNDTYYDTGQAGDFGRDLVFGGTGSDSIYTGNANDTLHGQDGADFLNGQKGNDTLYGGTGADTLIGEAGNDRIYGGNGRDEAQLGSGDDRYYDTDQAGEFGQDTVFGGLGNDMIFGGGGTDELHGQAGQDYIEGEWGRDLIYGGEGFDTIYGGTGGDTIFGGRGQDRIVMGQGNDRFVDTEQGGSFGADKIYGGAGNDVFVFSAAPGADRIFDFELGIDQIHLTQSLWGGGLSAAQVVAQFATVVDNSYGPSDVVLDFTNGQNITLLGITSTNGLADDIVLI